jgi:hypothetical protein
MEIEKKITYNQRMKKLFLAIFFAALIYSQQAIVQPKTACAATGFCCNPDPVQESPTTVTFWEYNGATCVQKRITITPGSDPIFTGIGTDASKFQCSATDSCVRQGDTSINTPLLRIPYPNYTCQSTAPPQGAAFRCCANNSKWDPASGCANGSAYVCLNNQRCTNAFNGEQVCTQKPTGGGSLSNQCCNFGDPDVTFDAATKQCIRTTVDGNGKPVGSGATATLCQTGQECVRSGYVPGDISRSFYSCSTTYSSTVNCGNGSDPNQRCVNTAFGIINTDPGAFITQIVRVGLGIGSGIALALIIFGSFKIVTSQGSPDALGEGKEIITSAIIGLIFMILSVSLMQILGVDILGLGGFGIGG